MEINRHRRTEINGATDKLYECFIGEFEDYGLRNDEKYIDVDQDFWILYLNRRTFDEDGNTLKEYDWYLRLVDEKFVLEDLDSFQYYHQNDFLKRWKTSTNGLRHKTKLGRLSGRPFLHLDTSNNIPYIYITFIEKEY